MDRRDFIKGVGAVTAAAAVGASGQTVMPDQVTPGLTGSIPVASTTPFVMDAAHCSLDLGLIQKMYAKALYSTGMSELAARQKLRWRMGLAQVAAYQQIGMVVTVVNLTSDQSVNDIDLLAPSDMTCCGLPIDRDLSEEFKSVIEIRDRDGKLYGRLINLQIPIGLE